MSSIAIRRHPLNPVLARFEKYVDHKTFPRDDSTAEYSLVRSPFARLQGILTTRTKVSGEGSNWKKIGEGQERLADSLERADFKLRTTEWISILFGAGLVVFLIAWWRFGVVPGLVLGVIVPYIGGGIILRFREKRRASVFAAQLSDVITTISNALKAGQSFPQALQSTSSSTRPPAGTEFSRIVNEVQLGMPIEEALAKLVARTRSEDLELIVSAVAINRIVGGNLAETLDSISTTIRDRVRIKGEIKTLTAQARVSGWILSLLPIGLAGILMLIAPDYFRPMVTDVVGISLLAAGGFSMLLGIAIIRKIVDVDI